MTRVECVRLSVPTKAQKDFERVFPEAARVIGAAKGFRGLRLGRSAANDYLLLIEWSSDLEPAEQFSRSPAYHRWRELVHPYIASSEVEYVDVVHEEPPT